MVEGEFLESNNIVSIVYAMFAVWQHVFETVSYGGLSMQLTYQLDPKSIIDLYFKYWFICIFNSKSTLPEIFWILFFLQKCAMQFF